MPGVWTRYEQVRREVRSLRIQQVVKMSRREEIERPVQRIQRYNRAGYWLTQGLGVVALAAFGLTGLWTALGAKQSHWSFYLMGGAYAIATLLFLAGLLVSRRENQLSEGNCHTCGGEIKGHPPDDWVLECADCGHEWVLARRGDVS